MPSQPQHISFPLGAGSRSAERGDREPPAPRHRGLPLGRHRRSERRMAGGRPAGAARDARRPPRPRGRGLVPRSHREAPRLGRLPCARVAPGPVRPRGLPAHPAPARRGQPDVRRHPGRHGDLLLDHQHPGRAARRPAGQLPDQARRRLAAPGFPQAQDLRHAVAAAHVPAVARRARRGRCPRAATRASSTAACGWATSTRTIRTTPPTTRRATS